MEVFRSEFWSSYTKIMAVIISHPMALVLAANQYFGRAIQSRRITMNKHGTEIVAVLSDMKVGDLVTLSAYGEKVKRTGWVRIGDIGIIKSEGSYDSYTVLWCNSTNRRDTRRDYRTRGAHWDWCSFFERRDLKFAKAKK